MPPPPPEGGTDYVGDRNEGLGLVKHAKRKIILE
jgi:hypothetical protein